MRKQFEGIDINELIRSLRYEDGKLYWLNRPREHFNAERTWKIWNSRFAGKEAFTSTNGTTGYKQGSFDGKALLRAWVVFIIHHKRIPERSVMRRSEDRTDDRIENLYEHRPRA